MEKYTQEKLNDILYRYSKVEDIDDISKLISNITSTLRFIRNHMKYYDYNAVKQMYNIRQYLSLRRSKLARKRRIA